MSGGRDREHENQATARFSPNAELQTWFRPCIPGDGEALRGAGIRRGVLVEIGDEELEWE